MTANTPLLKRASNKAKRSEPVDNPWTVLSGAERRVAQQLMQGLANKEIAAALQRSDATIKNQLRSIFRRTGYSARTRLIIALLAHRGCAGDHHAPDAVASALTSSA